MVFTNAVNYLPQVNYPKRVLLFILFIPLLNADAIANTIIILVDT